MASPEETGREGPARLEDRLGRRPGSLRVSVTDRCNLRCSYCMPEEEYAWLPRERILRFEEIAELVAVFASLGVRKVRLTGGEPLLRRDLATLVGLLVQVERIEDVALTTNGVLLAEQAAGLHAAGLRRVTVSLDTLRPERHRAMTRRDELERTVAGLDAALASGLAVKLNTVVVAGVNDDEVFALLEFARGRGVELRYIEYMDVGGATRWTRAAVLPRAMLLERLAERYGAARPLGGRGAAPAERFELPDGTTFGIIASTTQPFCGTCDRLRLTADGHLYTCLYARQGLDLGSALRGGATRGEVAALVRDRWRARDDRGAERRLEDEQRGALATPDELREDPRLEMHTRGG